MHRDLALFGGASAEKNFRQLCEIALDRLDPQRSPKKTPEEKNAEGEQKAKPLSAPKVSGRKRLSVRLRREVWRLAEGRCENCGSDFALEIDHRKPVCLGGGSDPANLRLLCRSCNARAAIEKLGLKKMDRYLNPNA